MTFSLTLHAIVRARWLKPMEDREAIFSAGIWLLWIVKHAKEYSQLVQMLVNRPTIWMRRVWVAILGENPSKDNECD